MHWMSPVNYRPPHILTIVFRSGNLSLKGLNKRIQLRARDVHIFSSRGRRKRWHASAMCIWRADVWAAWLAHELRNESSMAHQVLLQQQIQMAYDGQNTQRTGFFLVRYSSLFSSLPFHALPYLEIGGAASRSLAFRGERALHPLWRKRQWFSPNN